MIQIPKEMKTCYFCESIQVCENKGTHCFNEGANEFEGFELSKKIESYAKSCYEAGIKYANEVQIKAEDKE